MRYSNNLNIILKSIDKVSNYILRDFNELENLQSNSITAKKFTNSCYDKVKKIISEDLKKFKPDYNIIFSDDDKITSDESQYYFTVFAIDGISNLVRANSDFVVGIALSFGENYENSESIAVAIKNIVKNETFYCEKGFGSFFNNKRIKISSRQKDDIILTNSLESLAQIVNKKYNVSLRNYGSKILEIAYISSNKLDCLSFSKEKIKKFNFFLLLAKEAGIKFVENNNQLIMINESLI